MTKRSGVSIFAWMMLGVCLLGLWASMYRPGPVMQYGLCRLAFKYYLHQNAHEIEKESLSGESGVYYFTSYFLHGMLSAVEATNDERLLRRTLHYMDNMVATAKTIQADGETYHVWGPFAITPQSDIPKPNPHYTLQGSIPLARAAAIIRRTPEFRKKYDAQARRYIEFVDSCVIRYWYLKEFGGEVPWIQVSAVPIWNDNGTNMGLVATYLYQATGDPLYRKIALDVGEAFRRKLAQQGRGWVWESQTIPIGSDTDNTPGSVGNQAGVPDTSHTNREPMLLIALHEAGLMYSTDDIRRMGYTLVDNIWNHSYDEPAFSNYINGSDRAYRVYKEPGLNAPIYFGWALVGGYLPEAQPVLVSTLRAIFEGQNNPSLERNRTGYGGMIALSGHLMRNFSLLQKTKAPLKAE